MNDAVQSLVSVAIAIVGLAIIAVIVSKNAQTPQVVQSFTQGFASDIGMSTSTLYNLLHDIHLPNLIDAVAIEKATRGYVSIKDWVDHQDAVKHKKKSKKQCRRKQVTKSSELGIKQKGSP